MDRKAAINAKGSLPISPNTARFVVFALIPILQNFICFVVVFTKSSALFVQEIFPKVPNSLQKKSFVGIHCTVVADVFFL